MRRRHRVSLLVLIVLFAGLVSCSSGGGGDEARTEDGDVVPTSEAGNGGSDREGSASESSDRTIPGSGRPMPGGPLRDDITSIIQNAYYWSGDDDGSEPGDAAEMILVFEPSGRADLLVQDPESSLNVGGEWALDDGELSLDFDTEEVAVEATFEIDIEADEVTMPFRLLSGGADGESTWVRGNASIHDHMDVVFRVATLGDEQANSVGGVERAVEFAKALIDPEPLAGASNLRAQSPDASADPIRDVAPIEGGVEIMYQDGTTVTQLFFSFTAPPASPLTLTQGPLAGDPRTHLESAPTGDGSADPASKDALFVGSLDDFEVYSWIDRIFNGGRNSGVLGDNGRAFDWDGMAATLKDRDYSVDRLMDRDVTVEKLTEKLVEGGAPGVMIYNGHGASNGSLMTRDLLMEPADFKKALATADPKGLVDAELTKLRDQLRSDGYGDLVDYDGGNAIGIFVVPVELMVGGKAIYAAVKPSYWKYLREKQGVDFSQSLVYLAACDVDQSGLRDEIKAGSLWAYRLPMAPALAGAVGKYLVESIAKPTWTAEEAFYNLVRVVNTGQMTYQHDTLLNGQIPADADRKAQLFPVKKPLHQSFTLNAYGLSGQSVVPYAGNGWLDPDQVSGSQVWWMVWAARWGQDAKVGSDNLRQCWTEFWSRGTNGGLASPYCNAANTGATPTQPEVTYAQYLLTGQAPLTTAVPRWTLNETR